MKAAPRLKGVALHRGGGEEEREGGDDALVKSPNLFTSACLARHRSKPKEGSEEIWTRRHFSRGSDKCETGGRTRTAITRECRKFTTLTLGGARQTGTGDQSEREINKIQIDNEERLSFLIPHSYPCLASPCPSLDFFLLGDTNANRLAT